MRAAFDDLNFLMGSENRLAVLQAAVDEAKTREELVEEVDSSAVTVGRILTDLLDRGWIQRNETGYLASFFGQAIAEDAATLARTVETADRLKPVCEYMDTDHLDIDPRVLAHGTMSRGPEDSAFDHVDRWAQLFRSCDKFTGITSQVPMTLVEVLLEQLRAGELEVIGAFPGDFVDRLLDDQELRTGFREAIEHGASFYRDDQGDWDFAIGLYDANRMSFVGFDDSGTPRFKVESDHPQLRNWGDETADRILERSEPISIED
jgi:predicted transcriptional regulator